MRTRSIKILTVLLLGTLANFVVGWACAFWSRPMPFPEQIVASPGEVEYPRKVPSDWPLPFLFQHASVFGSSFVGAGAQVEPEQITAYDHVFSVGQSVFQFGLPLRTIEYESRLYALDPPSGPPPYHPIHFVADAGPVPGWIVPSEHRFRRLPLRPIWPGLAVNTLSYAALLWLLLFAPSTFRRHVRARRGLCPACGYPVGESAVCSECGRATAGAMIG